VTGREPYPTAVELAEVRHAMGASPPARRDRRKLPTSPRGECPLLAADGRCRIYGSRPFGCRTFFCREAEGPSGPGDRARRDAIQAIARRIADLSARFDPRDPHARPLVRALARRSG
jgi:Fe-S-cluster containining protein